MNLTEVNYSQNSQAISEDACFSRISQILEAYLYSKNLMIGIYIIEKDHFLFCNQRLRNIIGKSCTKLMEEGWNFWFSRIDPRESVRIKDRVTEYFEYPFVKDPLNLIYHVINFQGEKICLKHEILLHKVEKYTVAINYMFNISDKERLEHVFDVKNKIEESQYSPNQRLHISAREKEVLHLIANGFSSKEIADMLFISNHTAISHRKNLIEKFHVKNTAHLVTKAAGLIDL